MKQIVTTIAILFFGIFVSAQERPVHWSYTVKKIVDKTFEVHMLAKIEAPWHIYSQKQPEGAINIPVKIDFSVNPMISLNGIPKEIGKLTKAKDKTTGIAANEYGAKVDFVQVVKLKANVKTNISGVIHFQVCNEEMCLPPMSENFNIAIK